MARLYLAPLSVLCLFAGAAEGLTSQNSIQSHLRRGRVFEHLHGHGADTQKVHARESAPRVQVRKPVDDKRSYVHASFDTGMKVLAVTDPDATKTAFAVAVGAGSLEDPDDFQGLAHFCEHMLFLGSDKYPDKEEFTKHLAAYGGNHNAYTSSDATVYYNEINNAGLEKGLDIFAQFFIAPSFDRSMVNDEINAVDSEHKKNMPSVTRKIWNLLHSRASKENPMHKFSTGNLATLKLEPEKEGKDLVAALEKFHKDNYCPKRLHLVLLGNHSAEELIEMGHKAFDALPKNDACTPRPQYRTPAFSHELGNVGDRITLKAQGSPEMWVQFPMMPRLNEEYKSVPSAYVLNALGHYGPGGLKEALMEEDLSPSFSPMMDESPAGSAMLFRFSLTEKGMANSDRVLELMFAYLNTVRKEGVVPEKEQAMRQWRQVSFDYQPESSSEWERVEQLGGAVGMGHAPEDLLTGGYIIDSPNTTLSMGVIEALSPRRMNVIMVDPSFDEASAQELEPYYQAKYQKVKLSEDLMAKLEGASDANMHTAPAPRFVPTNLAVISEGSGAQPENLYNEGRVAVWWQGINAVKVPKGDVQLKIGFSSELTSSAEGIVLAGIHSRLVNRVLEGPTDELQMCGVGFGVSPSKDGLGVYFSGFDQYLEEMMKIVLPVVRDVHFEDDEFEAVRRQTLLGLKDISRAEPYQHAMQDYEVATVKGSFARKELVSVVADVQRINPEALRAYQTKLFEQAGLTMLFSGNINKERSEKMSQLIQEQLHISRTQAKVSHQSITNVLKPQSAVEVRVPNPMKGDPNSATFISYQVGIPTIEDRVKLLLISDIIGDPVFAELRTKHQLGYVVFGWASVHESVAEFRVLVQGFRKDPDEVEPLIESSVHNISHVLQSMTPEAFAERKKTAHTSLAKEDKTLGSEVSKNWTPLWQGHQCFDKRERMLAAIEKMGDSTQPLLDMWQKATNPGPDRKKIAVKLFGGDKGAALTAANGTANHTHDANGAVLVTLVDSQSLKTELAGEEYWPDQMLCE